MSNYVETGAISNLTTKITNAGVKRTIVRFTAIIFPSIFVDRFTQIGVHLPL